MLFKPIPILLPRPRNDITTRPRHVLTLFGCAPASYTASETHEVCTHVKQSPVDEVVVRGTVARNKAVDEPQASLNIFVQGELIQLCDHLAQV